ncbi:MAG TPA: heme o synthase [Verrucomicrobiae bacterium]
MKLTAELLTTRTAVAEKNSLAVYADLFKARLTSLVLLTTVVGFYAGSRVAVDYLLMLHTLLGTALVASGASALNQLWERKHDAKMRRTADRPLPSGTLQPQAVLKIGCGAGVVGLLYLGLTVNAVAAGVAGCSLLLYVFVYTPLKRVTWLNTLVGAVPGGLPPLIGWAAARGGLDAGGWILFGIQALWQLPHFMAIAWMYREEYARAGFRMLSVKDPDGRRTSRHAVVQTALLLPVSVLPFMIKLAGPFYFGGALGLGVCFLFLALQFARSPGHARAQRLFYYSLAYLPLLLVLMVVDKIK